MGHIFLATRKTIFVCGFVTLLVYSILPVAALCETNTIQSITVSREFFNPTLNQRVQLSFTITHPGFLTVQVVDRDGYIVKTLVSNKQTESGKVLLEWEGRDDLQTIVPDEAYSFKVDYLAQSRKETYFPANNPSKEMYPTLEYYDRQNGIVSYRLERPARVHMQAGVAILDPRTKNTTGPVMKTLVNREPRSSGLILERWNGFDESRAIYIPDLPDFKMAIAATALPENSVICTGNRSKNFYDLLSKRRASSLITFQSKDHTHHQGLRSLEDISPELILHPNGQWSETEKCWVSAGNSVSVSGSLGGPAAETFAHQSGTQIVLFVDGGLRERAPGNPSARFIYSIPKLPPGIHIVAVNWDSPYGPTATNSFRLKVESETKQK